jgi:CRP/FNR family transcriptional regulator
MSATSDNVLDLGRLRQSCASCGLVALCLPAAVSLDEMNRLDGLVETRHRLEPGQALYRQGAPASALFAIRSGSLKSFVLGEEGEVQIVGFHQPGGVLGLDALGGNRHRSTAQALERCNVCEVPYERLLQIAAQIPNLQRQLMCVACREIARDQAHLVALGRTQASQRLAIFLLALSDRYRELRRDPTRLRLSMSRGELANYLGLALETVSRVFSRLAVAEVIEVDSRKVRVLDFEALERLCHQATADEGHRAG